MTAMLIMLIVVLCGVISYMVTQGIREAEQTKQGE